MAARGFGYFCDPVFVVAACCYLANRVVVKPLVTDPSSFVHCQLGDVLCVPVCLPVALSLQRRCGLRDHDSPPTRGEVLWHWLFWSWCFEWLGPRLPMLAPGAIADPWDVVAYGAGAWLAAWLWRSPGGRPLGVEPARWFGMAAVAGGVALAVLASYAGAAALPPCIVRPG